MYSPKIKEDLIPILYRRSQVFGKPMTDLVDDILRPSLICEKADVTKNYVCLNCRSDVEYVGDDDVAYCEQCESAVFTDTP